MRRNHNYYTVLDNRFIEATRKEVPSINRHDLQQKILPQTPVEVGFVCSLTPHNASHRPTKKGEKNRTECFCAYRIKINYSVVFFSFPWSTFVVPFLGHESLSMVSTQILNIFYFLLLFQMTKTNASEIRFLKI